MPFDIIKPSVSVEAKNFSSDFSRFVGSLNRIAAQFDKENRKEGADFDQFLKKIDRVTGNYQLQTVYSGDDRGQFEEEQHEVASVVSDLKEQMIHAHFLGNLSKIADRFGRADKHGTSFFEKCNRYQNNIDAAYIKYRQQAFSYGGGDTQIKEQNEGIESAVSELKQRIARDQLEEFNRRSGPAQSTFPTGFSLLSPNLYERRPSVVQSIQSVSSDQTPGSPGTASFNRPSLSSGGPSHVDETERRLLVPQTNDGNEASLRPAASNLEAQRKRGVQSAFQQRFERASNLLKKPFSSLRGR
jgi:hypothetical protein